MKILGNILWWIFGGLEAAVCYLTGSLALAVTETLARALGLTIGLGSGCSGVHRGRSPIQNGGRPRSTPPEYAQWHADGPTPE